MRENAKCTIKACSLYKNVAVDFDPDYKVAQGTCGKFRKCIKTKRIIMTHLRWSILFQLVLMYTQYSEREKALK